MKQEIKELERTYVLHSNNLCLDLSIFNICRQCIKNTRVLGYINKQLEHKLSPVIFGIVQPTSLKQQHNVSFAV